MCEAFPLRNHITKKVVFLGLPDYNSVDKRLSIALSQHIRKKLHSIDKGVSTYILHSFFAWNIAHAYHPKAFYLMTLFVRDFQGTPIFPEVPVDSMLMFQAKEVYVDRILNYKRPTGQLRQSQYL